MASNPNRVTLAIPILPGNTVGYRYRFPYQVNRVTLVDYTINGVNGGDVGSCFALDLGGEFAQNTFQVFTLRPDGAGTIYAPTTYKSIPIPIDASPLVRAQTDRQIRLTEGKPISNVEVTINPRILQSDGRTEASYTSAWIYLEISQTLDKYQLSDPSQRASRLAQ